MGLYLGTFLVSVVCFHHKNKSCGLKSCSYGMLFLTDENIEILGGNVNNLIEENSQLIILNQLVTNAKTVTSNCKRALATVKKIAVFPVTFS